MFSSNIPYNIDLIAINNLEDKNKLNFIKKETPEDKKKENILLFKKILFELGYRERIYLVSFPKQKQELKQEITFSISNIDSRITPENYSSTMYKSGLTDEPFNSNNLPFLDIDSTDLILRPIESLYLNNFIDKWKSDRILFEDNILNIYIYGTVYDSVGQFLFNYIVTQKYRTSHDILKLDFEKTMVFYKSLLDFLNNVIRSNYIIRNLIFINSGLLIKEGIPIYILFDYNENSLVTDNGIFFTNLNKNGERCFGKECAGSLIPYYVMNDYLTMNPEWLSRLNKLYSLGLAEITLSIFYNQTPDIVSLYNFLTDSSKLESSMQYFHFVKKFNSMLNIVNLQEILTKAEIRFCNINPRLKELFSAIIMHLIDTNYDKIYSPYQIKQLFDELEKNNKEYKINYKQLNQFYNPMIENTKTIPFEIKSNIANTDYINVLVEQTSRGGGEQEYDLYYKNKYLKYKNKYLQLKNSNNF